MNLVKLLSIIIVLAGCSANSKAPDKADPMSTLEQNMKTLESQSANPNEGTMKLATDTETLVEEMKKVAPDPQKPLLAYMGKKISAGKKSLMSKDADLAKAHFSDGCAALMAAKPKK